MTKTRKLSGHKRTSVAGRGHKRTSKRSGRRRTLKTRRRQWRLKGGYNKKKCNKYTEKLEKIEATKEEIERKIKNYCTGLTRDPVKTVENPYERPIESIYKIPSNGMPSNKIQTYIPLAEQGHYASTTSAPSLYSPLKTASSR